MHNGGSGVGRSGNRCGRFKYRTSRTRAEFKRLALLIVTGLAAAPAVTVRRWRILDSESLTCALALALLAAMEGGLLMTQIRHDPAPLRAVLDVVLSHIESLAPRRSRTSP